MGISFGDVQIGVLGAADIALVSFIIYRIFLALKGTRALAMAWGLGCLIILYVAASKVGFITLAWLLGKFLGSAVLVVVILFQDEIRRVLTKVGLQPIFYRGPGGGNESFIDEVVKASQKLSANKLGALIILQREVGLENLVEHATILDAAVHRKLLFTLFLKESPLHDGAVLINGGRIKSAGGVLPLTNNPDLDPNLGTRHRAAIGLSERSDAIIVVVSEENSVVSLALEGKLKRNLSSDELRSTLYRKLTGREVQ